MRYADTLVAIYYVQWSFHMSLSIKRSRFNKYLTKQLHIILLSEHLQQPVGHRNTVQDRKGLRISASEQANRTHLTFQSLKKLSIDDTVQLSYIGLIKPTDSE